MHLNQLLTYVNSLVLKIPKFIENVNIYEGKINLYCGVQNISFVLTFLNKHIATQYSVLVDMTALDRFSKKNRFEIIYFLRTIMFNHMLILRISTDGYHAIPSSISIFGGSNWLEREIWDMFGIAFSNHNDLRRILTDYGFQGFPLRKDFPLTGFIEVRYDDELKRVIYDSIELSQEFRFFDFQSPWQNSEFYKFVI